MNREFSNAKGIRALSQKADKKNFYSSLQLYDYYLNGRFVEKDINEAQKYLKMSFEIFKVQNISIESIKIDNFRVFEQLNIPSFDSNLNIFIGNNGAGKTTILDAIELSLSWLSISINKNGGTGRSIDELDINNYSEQPQCAILSTIKFNKNIKADIELYQAKSGYTKFRNKLNEIRTVGNFYKKANEFEPSYNMPLLAYYNVMRSYDVNPSDLHVLDKIGDIATVDKFDAYEKSLSGKTDFNSFFKWFVQADYKISRSNHTRLQSTFNELGIDTNFLNTLESISKSQGDLKETYEKLKDLMLKSEMTPNPNGHSLIKVRDMINKVVSDFMDGYSDLEIQLEPSVDILIKKKNRLISVMRLSQGEKTLLALVLDISRRLIILNPSLKNPLEGQGIILIDEFDLHLHPKWQRIVAKKLKSTFPNCQFFLTTHSPLVISEVEPKHVFVLDEDNQGKVTVTRPRQTYGLTSNQILNEVMNDSDIPQLERNQEVEDSLDRIFDLIEKEDLGSLDLADKLIMELETKLNGDIPELLKAKTQLELQLDWLKNEKN